LIGLLSIIESLPGKFRYVLNQRSKEYLGILRNSIHENTENLGNLEEGKTIGRRGDFGNEKEWEILIATKEPKWQNSMASSQKSSHIQIWRIFMVKSDSIIVSQPFHTIPHLLLHHFLS
jgi:hypothetical protein